MKDLYKDKNYAEALFFGHLSLEKSLKALIVQKTKNYSPHLHDLLILAEKASLKIEKNERVFLDHVTNFNLEARYPDFKIKFYRICNKTFTDKYYQNIINFYQKVCQQIK